MEQKKDEKLDIQSILDCTYKQPNTTTSGQNLIYGMDKETFSNYINLFTREIQTINNKSLKNYKDAFAVYYSNEQILKRMLLGFGFNKNQKDFFKKFIEENLQEHFFQLRDVIKLQSVLERIDKCFKDFLIDFSKVKDLNDYFGINIKYSKIHIENNDTQKLVLMLKEMESTFYIQFYSYLGVNLVVDKIPNFLLKNQKHIIKEKVRRIWKLTYEIPVNKIKTESSYEFKYLTSLFSDFINDKPNSNIFDKNVFSIEMRLTIFKLLLISNLLSIKTKQYTFQAYLNNLKKYIFLMNLGDCYNEVTQLYDCYSELTPEDQFLLIDSEIEKLKHFMNETGKQKDTYLFMLFSISLMLNNLMTYTVDGDSIRVVCTPELICSAREREFLINFLKVLDMKLLLFENLTAKKVNHLLESLTFTALITSYAKTLYDEEGKQKIELSLKTILELMSIQGQNNDINIAFKSFLSQLNTDNNFINQVGTQLKSILSIVTSKFKEDKKQNNDYVDFSKVKLTPYDPINTSTSVCICISGFLTEDSDHEKLWQNISIETNTHDFYFYNWQSQTKSGMVIDVVKFISAGIFNVSVMNNTKDKSFDTLKNYKDSNLFTKTKENSKIFGRILAYIIASRSIFRFHTVNLVGFSLGCNVIKYCLKELNKINEKNPEITDIIQNVLFLGGATSINKIEAFEENIKIISGRVINCYSTYDETLNHLYRYVVNKQAIGTSPIICKNDANAVENYDLSYLKLDHHDYKRELSQILKRIKLF